MKTLFKIFLATVISFIIAISFGITFASCEQSDNDMPTVSFTKYDSIYFEKDSLKEKLSAGAVDTFLLNKYGTKKMQWFDSTTKVYWKLDSIEHEEMVKSVIKQAVPK